MPSTVTRELTVYREGPSTLRQSPVAASQTIVKGDLVAIADSSGRVAQAASAGANIGVAGANLRLAIAAQSSAAAAADTLVTLETVSENVTLRLPLCSGDTAQAWSNAYRSKQFEVRRRTTTGEYVVDVSASTNVKVEVIEADPATAADAAPFVLVKPVLTSGAWAR
jgi:hypothetical protein